MTLDQAIDSVCAAIYATTNNHINSNTKRCIRLVVQSMFNYSKADDLGEVGHRMQSLLQMVSDGTDMNGRLVLNPTIELSSLAVCMRAFETIRNDYRADCEAERTNGDSGWGMR